MSKSIGVYCPHCGTRMNVNGRKRPSPVLHQLNAVCKNPKCSATFSANVEIVNAIQPSLNPNPDVQGSLRSLNVWFKQLDIILQGAKNNPNEQTISHAQGFIQALYFCNMIDLAEAQQYTRQIATETGTAS